MFSIPEKYAKVAAALAVVLGGAASFIPATLLPAWATFALWGLASVAALFGGVAVKEYTGPFGATINKAAPILLSASVLIKSVAASLPPGNVQNALLALSLLSDAASGKAIPLKNTPPPAELPKTDVAAADVVAKL